MPMNKVGWVVYAAAAVGILLLAAQDVQNALLWLHDFSASTAMFALGLAAAACASFGPFALSLSCWRLAGRVRSAWAVHLLFIPCACAIVYAGASLVDIADGRAGTDEPAVYALTAAFLLLCLTVLVHAAALAAAILAATRARRANDS
jgi:hypothetical protein